MLGTGRPFSRHAGRARGRRGWYILCPAVPKLLKALWPAVPARSALPLTCGSVVLPTPWGPASSCRRPRRPRQGAPRGQLDWTALAGEASEAASQEGMRDEGTDSDVLVF